tara:strand:+ start:2777 stop:3496 length:720 start_codon:yes stop_codon:yes gene_type:complete
MASTLQTDKIETLSGQTIATYDSDLGWLLGKDVVLANTHHDSKIVKVTTYKQTLTSSTTITDYYNPRLILVLPGIILSSATNKLLIKFSFQPYISYPSSGPSTNAAGGNARYYIVRNSGQYNFTQDLTSVYYISNHITSNQGPTTVYTSSARFNTATSIGRGINIGWYRRSYNNMKLVLPSRTITVIDNSPGSVSPTYGFFGLVGHFFASDIGSSSSDPNHSIGLYQNTTVNIIMMEMT